MIRDVTYIVNTHIKYGIPLDVLLGTMNYIPKDRVKIVFAGTESKHFTYNGYEAFGADHNSFDYTGAIALFDHEIETADHVFFLQDTMEIGMNTDYFIRSARKAEAVAAFGGQCNLVLYRRAYLQKHKQYILERRNLSKLESIMHEGTLWKLADDRISFPNSTMIVQGTGSPYGGAERIKEYYHSIDLIKWKANYGQNMNSLILHP